MLNFKATVWRLWKSLELLKWKNSSLIFKYEKTHWTQRLNHLSCANAALAAVQRSTAQCLNNWGFETSKCWCLQTPSQLYLKYSPQRRLTAIWDQCISQNHTVPTIYGNRLIYHILTICIPCAEGIKRNAFFCYDLMPCRIKNGCRRTGGEIITSSPAL